MTKTTLIHLGLSILLLIGVGVAYVFWYTSVVSLRTEVATLRTETETLSASALQISAARSALAKLTEDETYFGSYFVSTSTVVSYLEALESAGDEFGAFVEVVSVTPEGKTRLAVSWKAEGSFVQVMRTAGVIEHGPYDAVMKSLTIDTNVSAEGVWTVSGVVSVGMRPDEGTKEQSGAPAAPSDNVNDLLI
ncbi:hypothetical protein K2Y00_02980 [Patescibacteria group bacterium]|nr:hypothetical protein [Patescibacteria group bacterium]